MAASPRSSHSSSGCETRGNRTDQAFAHEILVYLLPYAVSHPLAGLRLGAGFSFRVYNDFG